MFAWNIPAKEVVITLELVYISSSSSISFVKLLNAIAAKENGDQVSIRWEYEADDDESRKTGELLASSSPIPFHYVEIEG